VVRSELSDLQLQFLDFADRYELNVTRGNAKVGKLRAKLARATSDDLEDPEEYDEEVVAPPAPLAVAPATKASLWALARQHKGAA
jgi:hypothetical protein